MTIETITASASSRVGRAWPRSGRARLLRFAAIGSIAALVQLALLAMLVEQRWSPLPADIVAVVFSTQVNFVLSYFFTWGDRRPLHSSAGLVFSRWVRYQGSVGGTALLSLVIFSLLHSHVGPTAASALGALLGSALNFVAGDRLVFRRLTVAPQGGVSPTQGEPIRRPRVHGYRSGEEGDKNSREERAAWMSDHSQRGRDDVFFESPLLS